MSSPISLNCPNCQKPMRFPPEARGKKVRCKACEHVFVVPAEGSAPPAKAKPAAAKPLPPEFQKDPPKAKAKPVESDPPSAADAPIGFAKDESDDDDDDDAARPKPMRVIAEDDVPRCPHCATELDPPDTKICLNCGYDMITRRRHESRKVYEHTTEDYFMWWLPGIIWIVVMLITLTIEILCLLKMRSFIENNLDFLVKEDKNATTGKAQYYLDPDCFTVCFSVITLAVMVAGVSYCIKRLVINWRPPEVEKKAK